MSLDLAHLRSWLGRSQRDDDLISLRQAQLMSATVSGPADTLRDGDELPALWHWLYFNSARPAAELGRDGHPARGGFLPPVPLSNRMWAGGLVRWFQAVPIGAKASKLSTIAAVDHKQGRSGDLVFVSVKHEVYAEGALCLEEQQDIVYRDPAPAPAAAAPAAPPSAGPAMPNAQHQQIWVPDSTQLFRYSALTFNGHRIHYDVDYCRDVEGYPGLVVHGPLSATMLAGFAQQQLGRPLREFRYRGLKPSFAGMTLRLNAAAQDAGWRVWTSQSDGAVSFDATAQ